MSFMKTNSVKIITEEGVEYDSLLDFGLAIENTDYLGDPVLNDNLVFVPGRSIPLNYTKKIFGRQTFQYRPVKINFGKLENPEDWDLWMSNFRNKFHGKDVKLIFATLPDYYVTGRATIEEFDRKRSLGKFRFAINYADAYIYHNDETEYTLVAKPSGTTINIQNDEMPVIPDIITNGTVTVTFNGKAVTLADSGHHVNAKLQLTKGTNTLNFKGNSVSTTVRFRGGRL